MKIETKFNIGQEIYFIQPLYSDKAKVFKGKIIGIDYNKITHEPQYMTNSNGTLYYLIKQFFATKEEAEATLKELK